MLIPNAPLTTHSHLFTYNTDYIIHFISIENTSLCKNIISINIDVPISAFYHIAFEDSNIVPEYLQKYRSGTSLVEGN